MSQCEEQASAWETCPECRGHAMHVNSYDGEIYYGCDFCNDRGKVRRRDENGRFVGVLAVGLITGKL